MNTNIIVGLMVVAMLGVIGTLGAGLIHMVRGRDDVTSGQKANKLMWWRIYLQAGALALFALAIVMLKG